ncbi:MAG: YczE/YyaS/YitT family protein [Janthinobacterium lividum]
MSEELDGLEDDDAVRGDAASDAAGDGRWSPGPVRLLTLLIGLWLFGAGEALLVTAGLGNSPWTVLSQGLADHVGSSIGVVTIVVSAVVLLLWIPLRQRPGLGTVLNVVLVGTSIDVTLRMVSRPGHVVAQVAFVIAGIAVEALASGLYLGTALGPGPRDGLMTGLHRITGRSLLVCRAAIEGTVLVVGFLLGGTVGVGTVLFATLIGPSVQFAVRRLSARPASVL